MSQNPGTDPQIPLNTFAGLVTYMDPVALPAGASPDCSDMTFEPGGCSSRPPFQRIFSDPVYPDTTCTYAKSYKDPTGVIRNLYLFSNGGMTVEYPLVSPGIEVPLLDNYGNPVFLTPGSYAKSATAFGREYIAASDGLHGTDVPLQFDGTNLDRFTQDGPGSGPSIISLPLPAVALLNTSVPPTLTIFGVFPDQRIGGPSGPFTTLNIFVGTGAPSVPLGATVTVSGLSGGFAVFNGTYVVILNPGPGGAVTVSNYYFGSVSGPASGTLTIGGGGTSLVRVANVVTGKTTAAHQLQPGYQVQITGVPAGVIGTSIASIVIDNENLPGIATVTTATPHGLVPDLFVSITGVMATGVGGAVVSIVRAAEVVTVVMTTATGLTPGAVVTIAGVTAASFNTTTQVINVTTTTLPGDTFTYGQVDTDATGSGGTVALNWPIPDTPTPTYFQVQSAPTPTTFQVAINYPDGAWSSGSVSYAWDGTFYVLTVPTPTTFTYQQYGPDATATFTSGQTATPFGQAAPGNKQMQCLFLTRQGYTTAPCPPIKFVANGGQYYSVTNIPIGPPNVIARILAFTGAQGAFFFYIPSPPQVNGILVGTATQINDNTTTSVLLDFSDPTLFAALGISTQGNNLANQIVIDGALGFGFYGSRLMTYGQRSVIDNLLNMGFDGGALPNTPTLPTGWIYGSAGGALMPGRFTGYAWQIPVIAGLGAFGILTQSLYEDYTGAPIAQPNTQYTLRLWLKLSAVAADLVITVEMISTGTSFSSVATVSGAAITTGAYGSWIEVEFSAKTPSVIPPDLTLLISASSSASSVSVLVDEISIVFTASPYRNTIFGSYVNNPEGMDGVSGVFGPEDDTHPVMDLAIIRSNLYMLTQDPSGRLHETAQGITEPADWTVDEVAANCGAVSAFTATRSQADDATAAGGEEWFAWQAVIGFQIFGGQAPEKISQEIQRPNNRSFPGAPQDLNALNPAALLRCWGLNDPKAKQMWFGIPSNTATAPDVVYVLTYTGLDSASEIAAAPPVHRSLSGKLVATDLGRKWSPWQRPMNGAALLYRASGELQPVFLGGNGATPGTGGFGNAYVLNPALYTDDDYGIIAPYYVTYGMPDRDTEVQNNLGGGLKTISYNQAFFPGVGFMNWILLYNSLANQWPLSSFGEYLMQLSPLRNAEWAGGQATGQRFFTKFASVPDPNGTTANPATDNAFSLSVLVVSMRNNARMGVTGAYP